MKKMILVAALAAGAVAANAQQAIEKTGFADNWSVGIDGGVTTPIYRAPFWGDMRGVVGLNVSHQLTPTFGLGVEASWGVNTSSWHNGFKSANAFDNSYVGAFGTVNLFNLFGGYPCKGRFFDVELVAGAGWGHTYYAKEQALDQNYFATKVGLNLNFNVSKCVTVSLKPSFAWDMTSKTSGMLLHGEEAYIAPSKQSTCAYDKRNATFNLMAGVTFHFGKGFNCVRPYDQAEVDGLNAQINDLRGAVEAQAAENAALAAANAGLAAELEACKTQAPKVVKEEVNTLNSVRYVFFKIGRYNIGADQMPNVEMIAAYLKNHPGSTVTIKGYASPDGPEEVNIRLANQRAEAVKDALIKKYKVDANRIKAEGEGIGNMFKEESWNRVAICILDEAK